MVTPEKEFATVIVRDENRLLLARLPGVGLDLISSQVLPAEEYKDTAERALRELASISVRDLIPDGFIDSTQAPLARHHLFTGSDVHGWPRGQGDIEIEWCDTRNILATDLPVSRVLGAVLDQLNRR
jgi:hypothetical protein